MSTARRVRARVNGSALRHNFTQLEKLAEGCQVMPVIKADGYGHGALRVAHALEGRAEVFAVAAISEALSLRQQGLATPICILGGVQDPEDWQRCEQLALVPVVHDQWQLDQLLQRGNPPPFWLKFDTGMGRLGFAPSQASALKVQLADVLEQSCQGVMTHLACADEPGNAHTQAQLQCFAELRQQFPRHAVSIANSAACAAWPQTRQGVVRPGLALYGVDPVAKEFAEQSRLYGQLQPAMTLESRVMSVRQLPAGHTVGYGATWQARSHCRIAIIAAGYADGVMRSLSGSGFALRDQDGNALPLRGRVSMDMIAVELPPNSRVEPGDWLSVWGEGGASVEEAAQSAGTLSYELLTALGERVAHLDE